MSLEIDITSLPAPDALEYVAFEDILARKKAALIALVPENIRDVIAATLELASEPLTKDLEAQAYTEMLLRQRINEATAALMLALCTGGDLDQFGYSRGLTRKLIQPAMPDANPPVAALYESDAAFRTRIQMQPETYAVAGPIDAYIANAKNANPDVEDAAVLAHTPQAGCVTVYIKSYSNNGQASAGLVAAVQDYLSAETRRPLCDTVFVLAATPKSVAIRYTTEYEEGPDKALVKAKQDADLAALIKANSGIGAAISSSRLIGALDVPGARKVVVQEPVGDIVCAAGEYISVTTIESTEATS